MVEPSFIRPDKDAKRFRSLTGGDKAINLCVTSRELVGLELKILGPVGEGFQGGRIEDGTHENTGVRTLLF